MRQRQSRKDTRKSRLGRGSSKRKGSAVGETWQFQGTEGRKCEMISEGEKGLDRGRGANGSCGRV